MYVIFHLHKLILLALKPLQIIPWLYTAVYILNENIARASLSKPLSELWNMHAGLNATSSLLRVLHEVKV